MPDSVYDIKDAADYLGVKPVTVKYHLYVVKTLTPDRYIGRSPCFSQETLDAFQERKRPPGRPSKPK